MESLTVGLWAMGRAEGSRSVHIVNINLGLFLGPREVVSPDCGCRLSAWAQTNYGNAVAELWCWPPPPYGRGEVTQIYLC
jgi:hypothetical protein